MCVYISLSLYIYIYINIFFLGEGGDSCTGFTTISTNYVSNIHTD